jgi:hypothetical protein
MWNLFDLVGHGGIIIAVVCLAAAGFAFVYVPQPFGTYVAAALLLAAVSSQIYAAGYSEASKEWKAKYDSTLAKIDSENKQAVIAAQQTERELAKAQADAINAQVDQLAISHQQDQDEIAQLRASLANDKTAAEPLNEGIKTVIRGVKPKPAPKAKAKVLAK